MKLLFNPTIEDRDWKVELSHAEARDRIYAWLSKRSPRVISATNTQIIATMGSRFLTRMVGGAFSPVRWIPIGLLINMEERGRSSTEVSVRLADNLGVTFRKGVWRKLIRRRFDQVFESIEELWTL